MESKYLQPRCTYIAKWGLSYNEGGTPFNIHIRWKAPIGFYIYFYGRRLHWFKGGNNNG